MKNYYEVLEVDKNASLKVIKGVYKLHIKENHPDLFQGEEKLEAEEKIKKLNEAYEILSDEEKRKEYDKSLVDEYKRKLTQLKAENERLKNALVHEDNSFDDKLDEYEYEFSREEYSEQEVDAKSFEYTPDENVTYENNRMYINSLIQKEMLVKIGLTAGIIIAVAIGIYRATGFNIFKIFWDAIIAAFS